MHVPITYSSARSSCIPGQATSHLPSLFGSSWNVRVYCLLGSVYLRCASSRGSIPAARLVSFSVSSSLMQVVQDGRF